MMRTPKVPTPVRVPWTDPLTETEGAEHEAAGGEALLVSDHEAPAGDPGLPIRREPKTSQLRDHADAYT